MGRHPRKPGQGAGRLNGEAQRLPTMDKKEPTIDRVFQALGDPTRRAIMEKLSEGPVSVSRLAEPFGMTLAAVGQHVPVLEESRRVQTEKLGRVRTCRIEPAGLQVAAQWISDRRSYWERKLDRLDRKSVV